MYVHKLTSWTVTATHIHTCIHMYIHIYIHTHTYTTYLLDSNCRRGKARTRRHPARGNLRKNFAMFSLAPCVICLYCVCESLFVLSLFELLISSRNWFSSAIFCNMATLNCLCRCEDDSESEACIQNVRTTRA